MLILKTISNEKIWGTPRLHQYSGDKNIKNIGSVYTVSGTEELSSEIIYGDDNPDLHKAVKNNPSKFGLPENVNFPVIISFTAADENLSIQVHPTDDYAKKRHNKLIGKSESWYFISPPEKGWIYAEAQLEDKSEIKNKILKGDFEDVVGKYDVENDDLVYIQSGSLHALTKGSLVYEIQQSTDITYRFYDFDRIDKNGKKRELHLEDAIKTLNVSNKVEKEKFEMNKSVETEPYILTRKKIEGIYTNSGDIAEAITVTKGDMEVEGKKVFQGMSIIVLPKETITISKSPEEVVIARPKLYFLNNK